MLKNIIGITSRSIPILDGATLLCDYEIADLALIDKFLEDEIIQNIISSNPKIGDKITLEFSLFKLKSLGFYYDRSLFVNSFRYALPTCPIYLHELKEDIYATDFYPKYNAVVSLITVLLQNAKHSYDDTGSENLIIVREEKSLWLSLNYNSEHVDLLSGNICAQINDFVQILNDENFPDKKNIYLNALVEFAIKLDEEKRFWLLLENFEDFTNKASAAYNFYLTNFSYNKLKLEIDAKAVEYNQKLQAVINDSQTKLIAIPAAFVLVLSSIDYDKVGSIKNIAAIAGLFIFAALLQLFVNNQKSALKFIGENINYYKSTFKNQARKEVEKAFDTVSSEKSKQSSRLIYIEVLLWFIPFFTTSLVLFLLSYKIASIVIMFFFSWISSNKIALKY